MRAEKVAAIIASGRPDLFRDDLILKSIKEIAETLSVSKDTVSAAVLLLSAEIGSSKRYPAALERCGARKRRLRSTRLSLEISVPGNEDQYEELSRLRIVLESIVAGQAADKVKSTPPDLRRKVAQLVQDQRVRLSSSHALEEEQAIDLDHLFHQWVLDMAASTWPPNRGTYTIAILTAIIGIIRSHVGHNQRRLRQGLGDYAVQTQHQHLAILAAIARGDRPAAIGAMRRHLGYAARMHLKIARRR